MFALVALVQLLAVSSSAALSPDLVELARKEKARRAALTESAKVYTEADRGQGAPSRQAPPARTPAESRAPEPPPPPFSTAGIEGSWRSRALRVREALAAAERTLEEKEREFITFRSDLTLVSAAEAQDPLRLQKRDQRIFEMTRQIEAQKATVAEARQAVSNLEDEARRANMPAGWVR